MASVHVKHIEWAVIWALQRFAVGIMANIHIASGCEAVRHVG